MKQELSMARLRRFGWVLFLGWATLAEAVQGSEPVEPSLSLRRLVGLIEYIRGDFPEAVTGGKVVSETEFQEMNDFVEAAKRQFEDLADRLPPAQARELASELDALAELIRARSDYSAILDKTADLKKAIIAGFGMAVGPETVPDFATGQRVYAAQCASCHGAEGRGDGPAGRTLEPQPRNFHEPAVMEISSPFKFYNTLLTGIEGTAMLSYRKQLSTEELWSLAFYLSGLRHAYPSEGAAAAMANAARESPLELWQGLSLAEQKAYAGGLDLEKLAGASDAELRLWLARSFPALASLPASEASRMLASLRLALPYAPGLALKHAAASPTAMNGGAQALVASGLAYAREQIAKAEKLFGEGAHRKAEGELIDGYLYGFEKTETSFALIDPAINTEVERLFMEARAYARQGMSESFSASIAALRKTLLVAAERFEKHHLAENVSNSGEFLSSLVIIVREGFEAFLVVAALLALLSSTGQHAARTWVHLGWLSAIVAGGLTYVVFNWVLQVSGAAKETMEAVCTGIAVVLLFYTGFWLLSQAERSRWDRFIKQKAKAALSSGRLWAIFSMAFIAVYREAAETVVFYAALFSTARSPMVVSAGFVTGCLILLAVCWGIVRFNLRLPLRQFFMVTSCLMVAISIVLAGKTVHELVEAGYLDATPLIGVPSIDLLGIYPSLETLSAQLALLALGCVLAYYLMRKRKDVSSVSS